MEKKSALVLLLLTALWALTPAFACLSPANRHACCHGTAMQDCSSMRSLSQGSCCRVRSGEGAPLPAIAAEAVQFVAQEPVLLYAPLFIPPAARRVVLFAPEAPPPLRHRGAISILRV